MTKKCIWKFNFDSSCFSKKKLAWVIAKKWSNSMNSVKLNLKIVSHCAKNWIHSKDNFSYCIETLDITFHKLEYTWLFTSETRFSYPRHSVLTLSPVRLFLCSLSCFICCGQQMKLNIYSDVVIIVCMCAHLSLLKFIFRN